MAMGADYLNPAAAVELIVGADPASNANGAPTSGAAAF